MTGKMVDSSTMGGVHLVRSNLAVHPFSRELQWSHLRIYVNRLYVESAGEIFLESDDCASRLGKKEVECICF